MKKLQKSLYTISLIAFFAIAFTSCNRFDDLTGDFLIGTWENTFSDDGDIGYIYCTFNQNGTGRLVEVYDGIVDDEEDFIYVHYPEESRINIIIDDDEVVQILYKKISNKKVEVYGSSVFGPVGIWKKQ